MKLISWNIQWALGVDGKVDPQRIIDTARALGDFDVLCLQEVGAHCPALAGTAGENQFDLFTSLLPGFSSVPAIAVDTLSDDGGRRLFGNMIFSRYPVLRVMHHQLPWPVDPEVISMPRVMTEATLQTPHGPIRIMNTHLEYHSARQRVAQIDMIRRCHAESSLRALHEHTKSANGSPYHAVAQTTRTILTGDFNMRVEDPLRVTLQAPFDEAGIPRLMDTWQHLHPDSAHPHNVGLYDRQQWPEAFACDFIYASEDLLPYVRDFRVDSTTRASDHQPQLLELDLA